MDLTSAKQPALNCALIKSATVLQEADFNEINLKRMLNASQLACLDSFRDVLTRCCSKSPSLTALVARVAVFCGGILPDPLGEYKSLFERIIRGAIESYDALIDHDVDETDAFQSCLSIMSSNLHYAFYIRASLDLPPHKAGENVWDCISKTLTQWINTRRVTRYSIHIIEPQWTSIRAKDAGLLLIDYILPHGYPNNPTAYQESGILSCTAQETLFIECLIKERVKQLKKVVSTSTMQRIQHADFINNRVSTICWSLFRYFSEHLKHPIGGSFVEFHITAALTDFELAYEKAGASAAFMSFTKSLSEILPMAFSVDAVCQESGKRWSASREPLSAFIERTSEAGVSIAYAKEIPVVNRKDIFPVARLIFGRGDMMMWRIPLPGSERPGYCYGETEL